MATPTVDKTWEFGTAGANVNQAVGGSGTLAYDNADFMYKIKESLKSVGLTTPWSVWGSCDGSGGGSGVGFGNNDGVDRWVTDGPPNTYAKVKWAAAGSNHSWIVLEQAGLGGAQFCIDLSNATSSSATVVWSPGSGFGTPGSGGTGSDGTATARPIAGDEIVLISNTTWGGSSAAFYTKGLHVLVSSDGQCTRIILCRSNVCTGLWVFDKAKNPIAAWTSPYFAGAVGVSAATEVASYANWNDTARCSTKYGATTVTNYMTSLSYAGAAVGENLTMPDDQNIEWIMSPINLASLTATHRGPRKGTVYDLWWGSTGVQIGKTYPDDATMLFVQFGNLILPWNGTSPLIG